MGVQGRAAGFIATLYYVDTVISTKNANTVPVAANTSNQVIDVADMGSLSKTRNIIDVPVYGEDVASKLPGQADPGTFDFNVTMNLDDSVHTAIRDDEGTAPHSWILKFTQGANTTYACFDGYVGDATVSAPIDDRIQMDVAVARSGAVSWIDT